MRTISSSILAALVVVALFWGNCFSCPQTLLALKLHQPSHGCCHRSKQAPQTCQTQVLRHFVKDSQKTVVPSVRVTAQPAVPSQVVVISREFAPLPAVHTPPDLLALQASFRI